MSKENNTMKRLKSILKAIGRALGILGIPQENQHEAARQSPRPKRNVETVATNRTPKRKSTPGKKVVTSKSNVKDVVILGAALHMMDHHVGKHHKYQGNEEIIDEYDLLHDDEFLLYDSDEYNEGYAAYDGDFDAY